MPEEQPTRDRVLVEMTIAAPPDAVWDAIRDPVKIYNWFGWDAETLKEEIDFIFAKHVRADDAARVLYFGGVPDRFEVEPRGDGCILRVVRAIPADAVWDDVYEDIVEGWISFVQQLRLAIEQHGLGARRTVYLEGSAVPGGRAPIAALGLDCVVDTRPGEAVHVTLAAGDVVDGIAWHRTSFQFGLTVPQWGNGLLIVTDKSATETSPDGRGMVVVTTYGLSGEAFDALTSRWKTWWDEHFAMSSEPACG